MSDVDKLVQFEARKKSVGLAYVLWFFAGMVGGHRYYAGRWKTGLLQSLGGVAWIVAGGSIAAVAGLSGGGDQAAAEGVAGVTLAAVVYAVGVAVWVFVDVFLVGGWVKNGNVSLAASLSAAEAAPLVLVLLAFAAPVQASEMPRYDVAGHCATLAALGGNISEVMRNACVKQEQAAYNALKDRWATVPAATVAHCDGVARLGGGGSYTMLNACVQQEKSAKSQPPKFQY